jgi:hypothetical protein
MTLAAGHAFGGACASGEKLFSQPLGRSHSAAAAARTARITMRKVRLVAGKAAPFSALTGSIGSFDRIPLQQSKIGVAKVAHKSDPGLLSIRNPGNAEENKFALCPEQVHRCG